MWATNDVLANPDQGEILADTGAVIATVVPATIILWTDHDALVEVAERNTANNADVHNQVLGVKAAAGIQSFPLPLNLTLNQRVVIRMADNLVEGQIQGSIVW